MDEWISNSNVCGRICFCSVIHQLRVEVDGVLGETLCRNHTPDADQESVNALVDALGEEVRKHDTPLGMHRTIGDPDERAA